MHLPDQTGSLIGGHLLPRARLVLYTGRPCWVLSSPDFFGELVRREGELILRVCDIFTVNGRVYYFGCEYTVGMCFHA